MFDIENLGNKAFAVPLAICLVLVCVLGLAVAPILGASPRNVPFAIVSLDEGAVTFAGEANVGETLAENLISGEASLGGEGDAKSSAGAMKDAIEFTRLDSEEELAAALEANEYYGAIVIPENFTSAQMLSATGIGEPPVIKLVFNQAKNPMIANTMKSTIASALLQVGIVVEVETVNSADIGGGALSGMMAVQMLVMPLMMMVMIPSIMTSVLTWPREAGTTRKQKARKALVHAAFLALLSLLVAALALSVVVLFGGMDLPVGRLLPFIWLAAYCMMLAAVGLCDLFLPLGVLATVTVFALGMGTAMMPPEMLPEFWANWVCPWAPQAAIGEGVRSIVYIGAGSFDVGASRLLALGAVGAASLVAAIFAPSFNPVEMHEKMAAKKAGKKVGKLSERRAAKKAKKDAKGA